jgi:hypothetical protein
MAAIDSPQGFSVEMDETTLTVPRGGRTRLTRYRAPV